MPSDAGSSCFVDRCDRFCIIKYSPVDLKCSRPDCVIKLEKTGRVGEDIESNATD